MNVGQVIELAKEWSEGQSSQISGFYGAHLMGNINHIPRDSTFPAYKDVDMNMLVEGIDQRQTWDLNYKGLILECGLVSADRYRSAEVVLSDPELASNLAADSILCDPYGMLVRLHEKVAQEYSKREWVLARCEAEKQRVQQGLDGLKGTDSVMEALPSLQPLFEGLTGMVAVAGLRPPTHRRGLIVMREVLEGVGKVELIEETLEFFGFDDLSRREVDDNLRMCAEAFDKAVAVSRTPVLGSFKLQEHVRPYVVDGTQEMIDDGFHREAMYWVLAFMVISNGAIEVDAPEKEKGVYRENFERLLNDIGWWTHADLERREGQARSLADKVFQAAEEIVA